MLIHRAPGKKTYLLILITVLLPSCVYSQTNLNPSPGLEGTPSSSVERRESRDSLVGTVRVQNGKIVNLETAAKTFRLEGLIVPYLLKEDGKQWRVEGRITDELILDAIYAVPLQTKKISR